MPGSPSPPVAVSALGLSSEPDLLFSELVPFGYRFGLTKRRAKKRVSSVFNSRNGLVFGLVAVTLLSRCTSESAPPTAGLPWESSLLDRLSQAHIEGPGVELLHSARNESSTVHFAESFDEGLVADWRLEDGRKVRPGGDQTQLVAMAGAEGQAFGFVRSAGAVHIDIPCSAEHSVVVRARMFAASVADARQSGLQLVPLSAEREVIREIAQRPQRRGIAEQAAGSWTDVVLFEQRRPGRAFLRLVVTAGVAGTLIDQVEVLRLSPVESLRLQGILNPEASLRARMNLDQEEWDCLLLPCTSAATFTLKLPTQPARLQTSLAAITQQSADAVQFEILVNGELLEQQELSTGVPWRSTSVDLRRWAGQQVELCLRCSGEPGAVACVGAPRVLIRQSSRRPNVVLLSIDTLRPDHLGCYGHDPQISPFIDEFAEEGLLFEQAYSPSSYTLPTHVTLMTGQDSRVHGVHTVGHKIDRARSPVLVDALRRAGYVCAAFTGGGYVDPTFGHGEGFDRYSVRDPATSGKAFQYEPDYLTTTSEHELQKMEAWISAHQDQPFFLFLHTYLVHNYTPDPQYCEPWLRDSEIDRLPQVAQLWAAANGDPVDREAVRLLHQIYRATIQQMDERFFARVMQALEQRGLSEQTLVVLVADHGEAFLEHQEVGHGKSLWNELVRVPLILRGPKIPKGVRQNEAVHLADVAPTILDILELDPDARWTGRSLLDPAAEREAQWLTLKDNHSGGDWDGVIAGQWKLLLQYPAGESAPRHFLFDLDADPAEQNNGWDEFTAAGERMQQRLQLGIQQFEDLVESLPSEGGNEGSFAEPELLNTLRQLGYLDDGS